MTVDLNLVDLSRSIQNRIAPRTETPSLDAQVLLAHILGKPRAWVLAHPETRLTPEQSYDIAQALERLESGTPLPYVIGHREFFGLKFNLTPDVLIPRPETELMVEQALLWVSRHPACQRIADVGTGSGCVAISLAVHLPQAKIWAGDISNPALKVARSNAILHHVDSHITFARSDLLGEASGLFDVICANLPYIPSGTLVELPVFQHEPALALDGGPDGLDLIRRLLQIAPRKLAPPGLLLIEIEARQGMRVTGLAEEVFPGAKIDLLPDLAGLDRLIKLEPRGCMP